MSTFAIIAGSSLALILIVYYAIKLHDSEKEKEENLEENVEQLKDNIDSEMEELKERIDEFEI